MPSPGRGRRSNFGTRKPPSERPITTYWDGTPTMIGSKSPAVEKFWQECRAKHGIKTNDYHVSTFADPRYATYHDELIQLVEKGKKRATAHMALDFEKNKVAR